MQSVLIVPNGRSSSDHVLGSGYLGGPSAARHSAQTTCHGQEEAEDKRLLLGPVSDADAANITSNNEDVPESARRRTWAHVLFVGPSWWMWHNGMACGAMCQFIFSLAALFVKLMAGRVPLLEFTTHRSAVSWALTLAVAWQHRLKPVYGHAVNRPKLIIRGTLQSVGMISYYGAMYRLPLPDIVVIGLLHPPLTAALSRVFLKEPLGWIGSLGCVLGLAGVVVLARPPFLFDHHQEAAGQLAGGASDQGAGGSTVVDGEWGGERMVGVALGLVSASFQAASNVYYKFVCNAEPALVLSLWFHIITFAMSVVPTAVGWPEPAVLPSLVDHLLLLGVALASFSGHLLMSRAFQLLPASIAAMFSFTVIGWAYLYDLAFFHDALTWTGLVGTLLIGLGVMAVVLRGSPPSAARKAQPEDQAVELVAEGGSEHKGSQQVSNGVQAGGASNGDATNAEAMKPATYELVWGAKSMLSIDNARSENGSGVSSLPADPAAAAVPGTVQAITAEEEESEPLLVGGRSLSHARHHLGHLNSSSSTNSADGVIMDRGGSRIGGGVGDGDGDDVGREAGSSGGGHSSGSQAHSLGTNVEESDVKLFMAASVAAMSSEGPR